MSTSSNLNKKIEKKGFDGWREFLKFGDHEAASADLRSYYDRLSRRSAVTFSEFSNETDLEIIDISPLATSDNNPQISRTQLHSSESVEQYLSQRQSYHTRIISLHCQTSIDPIKITEECLRKVFTYHTIGLEFLDLIFSFGEPLQNSDAGFGSMMVTHQEDGSYDMCYMNVHIEEFKRREKTSWALNQTAVFHRFVPNGDGSLWIFVHPKPNSMLHQRLDRQLSDPAIYRSTFSTPHMLALSSCIDNWRWYLREVGAEVEEIAFKPFQKLERLQEKIIPLTARFKTSISIIDELQTLNQLFTNLGFQHEIKGSRNFSNFLARHHKLNQGHLLSVELLGSRVRGIFKLLSVALNLKNQATSVDINHNMLLLTKDTVDDSATVRVVTLVTLIYLPPSFVASVLGMNLFSFQTHDDGGFEISHQFWIFIALAVPLTVLTLGSWVYINRVRKINKAKDGNIGYQKKPGIEA